MKSTREIQLINVLYQGQWQWLIEPSCLSVEPVTMDLFKATDYSDDPDKLLKHLNSLIVEGDTSFSKSGLRIDGPPLVQTVRITTTAEVLKARVGREAS
jgi:hypothetical protein